MQAAEQARKRSLAQAMLHMENLPDVPERTVSLTSDGPHGRIKLMEADGTFKQCTVHTKRKAPTGKECACGSTHNFKQVFSVTTA